MVREPPLPPPTSCLSVPSSPRGDPRRRPSHATVRPTSPVGTVREPPFPLQHHPSPSPLSPRGNPRRRPSHARSGHPPVHSRNRPPHGYISLPTLPRRGDPSRRPLHSTVQPTSPVEAVHEPPFPFQHHASPSPLPLGATLVVARYMRPCGQPPRRGGSGTALPPPTSSLSVHSPPRGDPRRRPLHSTVRPTSPVGAGFKPPLFFPLYNSPHLSFLAPHHAIPSPSRNLAPNAQRSPPIPPERVTIQHPRLVITSFPKRPCLIAK